MDGTEDIDDFVLYQWQLRLSYLLLLLVCSCCFQNGYFLRMSAYAEAMKLASMDIEFGALSICVARVVGTFKTFQLFTFDTSTPLRLLL